MSTPLLPKGTAVWLIDNTALTFEQIAAFCGLHALEVKAIADGEVASGILGVSPIDNGQLTKEMIQKCEKDPNSKLHLTETAQKYAVYESKRKAKYVPVARRGDKPDAISWLLKHCPDIKTQQITKLIGTTRTTVDSIRDRTHRDIANIRPRDPVFLGLCTQMELDKLMKATGADLHAVRQAETLEADGQ
jgi:hypothetical protein